MKKDLEKLVNRRKHLKQATLTYSEYLELFKDIRVNLANTHDISLLDETVRKFFSNFTVKPKTSGDKRGYIITHELREPWAKFVKDRNFERGRG